MDKLNKLSKSYGWVKDIENKVIIEFKKTYDILDAVNSIFFNKYNTSDSKFNILVLLYKRSDDGLMLSEIGERMLVTKANITGLVDRLEKEGLVNRIRDNVDRRKIMAVITDKGKLFVEMLMKEYTVFTDNLFKNFSDSEKEMMIKVLSRVQQELISM